VSKYTPIAKIDSTIFEILQLNKLDTAAPHMGFTPVSKAATSPTQKPEHIVQLINLPKKVDFEVTKSLTGSKTELDTRIIVSPAQPNVKRNKSTILIVLLQLSYIYLKIILISINFWI
jgi:hypothetical protein|tara:strand:- start:2144 stop:2497 length:354 start_codon:yes stop_codon:yes gene_type:complete